jgi:hypothetical protein
MGPEGEKELGDDELDKQADHKSKAQDAIEDGKLDEAVYYLP